MSSITLSLKLRISSLFKAPKPSLIDRQPMFCSLHKSIINSKIIVRFTEFRKAPNIFSSTIFSSTSDSNTFVESGDGEEAEVSLVESSVNGEEKVPLAAVSVESCDGDADNQTFSNVILVYFPAIIVFISIGFSTSLVVSLLKEKRVVAPILKKGESKKGKLKINSSCSIPLFEDSYELHYFTTSGSQIWHLTKSVIENRYFMPLVGLVVSMIINPIFPSLLKKLSDLPSVFQKLVYEVVQIFRRKVRDDPQGVGVIHQADSSLLKHSYGFMMIYDSICYMLYFVALSKFVSMLIIDLSLRGAGYKISKACFGVCVALSFKDMLQEIIFGSPLKHPRSLRKRDYLRDCRACNFGRRSMTITIVMARYCFKELGVTSSNIKQMIIEKFAKYLDKEDNEPTSCWITRRDGFTGYVTLSYALKCETLVEFLRVEECMGQEIVELIKNEAKAMDNLYLLDKLKMETN